MDDICGSHQALFIPKLLRQNASVVRPMCWRSSSSDSSRYWLPSTGLVPCTSSRRRWSWRPAATKYRKAPRDSIINTSCSSKPSNRCRVCRTHGVTWDALDVRGNGGACEEPLAPLALPSAIAHPHPTTVLGGTARLARCTRPPRPCLKQLQRPRLHAKLTGSRHSTATDEATGSHHVCHDITDSGNLAPNDNMHGPTHPPGGRWPRTSYLLMVL